ncbi:MAG: thioredoxin family protein [Candidatus Brocadia sp. WS118]|nr:MAG: thioredoxin family protein [Candidatus Brocadia sp. WS118]
MTYPDAAVIDFINKNFIPLQINVQSGSDLPGKYRVFWTPTLLVLDSLGTEYYRFNGFLPPDEFLAQLHFGLGFMALERQDYKAASVLLKLTVDRYPRSDIAPEAQYWYGVSEYKSTHKVDALLQAWRKIKKDYAHSIWAKKVSFVKD